MFEVTGSIWEAGYVWQVVRVEDLESGVNGTYPSPPPKP